MLLISTVRIQLHVSVLYVGHLQVEIFNLQISYTRCVGRLGGQGVGWGTRSCFGISNYITSITQCLLLYVHIFI